MSTSPQFPGQQGPGQPVPGQPYPGQQGPGQSIPGQPYPGQQFSAPTTPPKKPLYKRWWFWVLAVILVIGIGSMSQGGSSRTTEAGQQTAGADSAGQAEANNEAPAPPKAKLTLDDGWEIDRSNMFAVYVNGYVTNNTDKAITNYIQITFDALDAEGANLGTCLANTNTIDAHGRWKFKAICSGEAKEITEVRFKDITGF